MRLDPIAGSGDAPKRHSEPPPARQAVLDARRKELAEQIAALCAANAAYAEHVCTFGRVLRGGLLRPSLLPDPLHSDDVACRNPRPDSAARAIRATFSSPCSTNSCGTAT